MSKDALKVIYLQPECCADPSTGRLWCEDDNPERERCDNPDCDGSWHRYVLDKKSEIVSEVVIETCGVCGARLAHFCNVKNWHSDDATEIRSEFVCDECFEQ